MPNGLCYMHGGKALPGIANPAWKHGRYSKYLPKRMMEDARASAEDPDRIALQEELTIIDALIADRLKKVDTGESGALWRTAQKALGDLETALRPPQDPAKGHAAMSVLRETLSAGVADSAAWSEVQTALEQKRRFAESEQNRMLKARNTFNEQQSLGFLDALIDTVRRNVTDPDALRAITEDIAGYLGTLRGHRGDADREVVGGV